MECRLTQKLKKKLFPVLSGLLLTSAFTLSPAALPAAEAFDWSNAIGSVILVSAQYSMLNKQVAYLDGKGRGEYLEQIKGQEGVNEDPEANAMLDRVMGRLSTAIAKTDPSIEKNPYHYFVNDSTKFNAYCTLGHNVSVNIGLFTTLNYNEDELAFVLGHELGHGEQHDPANGVKRTFPIALLAAVAGSQSNMLEAVGTNLLANLGSAKLVDPAHGKESRCAGLYLRYRSRIQPRSRQCPLAAGDGKDGQQPGNLPGNHLHAQRPSQQRIPPGQVYPADV